MTTDQLQEQIEQIRQVQQEMDRYLRTGLEMCQVQIERLERDLIAISGVELEVNGKKYPREQTTK